MPSPTGEDRPSAPVACCGSFQANENHFVWNEVAGEWRCALKGSQPPPEPPERPAAPPAEAPKPSNPRQRATRRKS